ncbi:MAG: hypothetical protein GTO24_12130 [candidate division Zixibacteria bacterium]|nr:hypothetical protein [candidate division Zixibacteria bacterium]
MWKVFVAALLVLLWISTSVAQVDTAWVRRYNGSANGSDHVSAVAIDDEGSFYVTGYSHQSGKGYDYLTIKYNPNGDTAWVRSYGLNGADVATDIAADHGLGQVYVTGWLETTEPGGDRTYDFATVKYDWSGNQEWVRWYDEPGEYFIDVDKAVAVAYSRGGIYVTGESWGYGTGYDYATVKYDTGGNEAWVRRYHYVSEDCPKDIAADAWGNVFVTGFTWVGPDYGTSYQTVKYSPEGARLNVWRYEGPGHRPFNDLDVAYAVAVDSSGNAFVTGTSESGDCPDIVTIKYGTGGTPGWVQAYGPYEASEDNGYALACDDIGNVYVAGRSWAPATRYDYVTIKYDGNGDQVWVARYDGGISLEDEAWAIALDQYGNVYVTGASKGEGSDYDFATVKYSPQGSRLWVKRYDGLGGAKDAAWGIAVDDSGNVYVAGTSWGDGTEEDYVVIKYRQPFIPGDANGDMLVDPADVVYLINYLFRAGLPPYRPEAGDANCDGQVAPDDVVYLINYLFRGGPPPCG